MRTHQIQLAGQSFHLREWGDPALPALLMLNGFPEYSGAWEDLAPLLAHRFHVIAPDQRGYGQSWCPEGVEHYAVKHLVGDMAALIDSLGGPVAVLGHDWGASVSYALAIRRPDLVSRLVILNGVHPAPFQRALAAGGAQTEASQYITWLRRDGSEARLAENGYRRLLELFAEGMDMSWMTPDRRAAYVAEWSRPGRMKAMVDWYRASPVVVPAPGETCPVPEFDPDKLAVRMPHLLVWGTGDTALLEEATEGLEAFCADLTRVRLDGLDHWLAHQAPDRVAAAVLEWFDARGTGAG